MVGLPSPDCALVFVWWFKLTGAFSLPGIVSAPVWDSRSSTFAGLLTSTDYINVIQYYCQFPDYIDQVDQFRLSSLRGEWRRPGMGIWGSRAENGRHRH